MKVGRGGDRVGVLVVMVASKRSRERSTSYSSGGAKTRFYKCRKAANRRSEHALPNERSITNTALLSLKHHVLLKTVRIPVRIRTRSRGGLLRRYSP